MFGPNRAVEKTTRRGALMICTLHQIPGWSNQEDWDGMGMQHIWNTGQVLKEGRWRDLKETDHLKDPGVDGSVMWEWIIRKWDGEAQPAFIGSRPQQVSIPTELSRYPLSVHPPIVHCM
jgi:hypothetical protein